MCITQTVLILVALYVGSVRSWDLAVANGDVLEFYINQTKIDTVHFKSQNLGSLAYDEVHNMIIYVNKQRNNDTICVFNMSTMQYIYLTEFNGRNIRGLAFDPATELVFFTDTKERTINSISLKPGSEKSVNGTILFKMDDGVPTDIAIDSCRGYIYWINTNLTKPTIERARLNGTDRSVVIYPSFVSINTTFKLEPHSLAIDQQTQKIYWLEAYNSSVYYIYSADLDGTNKETQVHFKPKKEEFFNPLNTLSVSKQSLIFVGSCPSCDIWNVWNLQKSALNKFSKYITFPQLHKEIPVSVVGNYKLSDQIQGQPDCQALTSLTQNKSLIDNTFKIAAQYGAEFCVHGRRVDGQSLCKCAPGYTGERCDVSVCENFCIHGNCSVNEEGVPKCSCDASYSGERCQVDACRGYCQNDGHCFLVLDLPVCECKGDFVGARCEVTDCVNYCIHGNCSFNNEEIMKSVMAEADYRMLADYRLCKCAPGYTGERCDVSVCENYCIHGNCSVNEDGLPKCSCDAGYSGERCQVGACHGYCQNGGNCSLNEINEPVCECKGDFVGARCEVTDCLNYCIRGNCNINDEGLPKCSCVAGYSGERCEVNACQGYCLNDGECSLNEEDEPTCQCISSHEGSRCDVVKTDNFPSTRTSYTADSNLSLADIFSKWRKPISKMTVILESN